MDVTEPTSGAPVRWDPERYLQFADHRSRPFDDLLARVGADNPRSVVDLGCGPGQLTARLARRWPAAKVIGVDSSPEMIAAARAQDSTGEAADGESGRLSFRLGDLRAWVPETAPDVIVSNATLQWLPDQREQIVRLAGLLAPAGWLAVQLPGNFGEPSHRLLDELAADQRFAGYLTDIVHPGSYDPAVYLADLFLAFGRQLLVDTWETTYLQCLHGPDPVFDWISGTGARPVLQALPDELRTTFVGEYKQQLRAAYPSGPAGTVLPYRRIFVVARRSD